MGMDNNLTARKRETGEWLDVADWRKHQDLHAFIAEHCYASPLSKYIDDPDSWNGADIHLPIEYIEEIIAAYESGKLETGWGNSKGKVIENDIDVFLWAKELIKQGWTIWYSANY